MSEQQNDLNRVVSNGVRLAGDTLLAPGTSLLLDGQVGQGAARVAVGIVARMAVGPVGWLLVAADAYTKSSTGSGLLDRVVAGVKSRRARGTPAEEERVDEPPPKAEQDTES